jgi:hypothetical protein
MYSQPLPPLQGLSSFPENLDQGQLGKVKGVSGRRIKKFSGFLVMEKIE